ncbi:ser arg-related nuclear matrix protein [Colletotrichum truncatum]|uniref:Ser arg-related nuclear matrix protein n=1 Tax=Colletotrichum truncatum TaxID=5467 RepID=A0ACC3ZI10_COLTU|nr:ser arg-related nuclear matrix protein [Colletotrichum truncatum]KAF6786756.1 ser arg-related nuclear matrix protein [Colletotrichum truncatum]
MNEPRDIEDLLQNGYFKTSRAKTPKPSDTEPPAVPPHNSSITRTNYNPDPQIPRFFDAPLRLSHRKNYPPPPSVEDETASLLREHGSIVSASSDEPPSRGDAEQHPIIMEVHEYNPERRFVIVPKSASEKGDEDSSDDAKSSYSGGPRSGKQAVNGDYEANTGRKYHTSRADDMDSPKRPELEKRKSRQDLPRIETDVTTEQPRTKRHERTKSATRVEQQPSDYFSKYDKRQPNETLLSPQVIKHATGGREKVYYDYSQAGRNGVPRPQRSHSNLADQRRFDDNYTRQTSSSNPPPSRRSNTNIDSSKEPRQLSGDRVSESPRYQRERVVPRGERPENKDPSPPYDRSERDRESKRTPTYKRDSPRRRDDSGSSSSDYSHTPRTANARRRRSIVNQEGRENILSPEQARPSQPGRSRSRAPPEAVMPSPRVSTKSFTDDLPPPPPPRSSQTFPVVKDPRDSGDAKDKPTPYPDDDLLPGTSRLNLRDPDPSRSRSRASTFNVNNSVVMPAVMPPMPVPAGPRSPTEKRRSPERRPVTQPGGLPPQAEQWPPAKFDPAKTALAVDGPRGSYRRYSHDADRGGVPDFPDCPRKEGVVGYADWLSLPRCDNFNICPDCYNGVFLNTEFRNDFMPMLFRPMDKPIACDFGSCGWYHIAWLLTLKNRHTDLRLFYQVANVASKVTSGTQPCPGDRRVTRVWYSLKNPYSQTTMPDFTVCYECAKTIEGLLPNLTGVFVTLHPAAQPTRGTCAMHFNPDRKRFVMYFDTLETTSDIALATTQAPNIGKLVSDIESLSVYAECCKDNPVYDQNWHVMQFLPQFTVCGDCFDEVVAPQLKDGNIVARNFYVKPQRIEEATCQLYSTRMRAVFDKACRRNDPKYLEVKVLERQKMFVETYKRLSKLEQERSLWAREESKKLLQEWEKWE